MTSEITSQALQRLLERYGVVFSVPDPEGFFRAKSRNKGVALNLCGVLFCALFCSESMVNAPGAVRGSTDGITTGFLDREGYFDKPIQVDDTRSEPETSCIPIPLNPLRTTGGVGQVRVERGHVEGDMQAGRDRSMAKPQTRLHETPP